MIQIYSISWRICENWSSISGWTKQELYVIPKRECPRNIHKSRGSFTTFHDPHDDMVSHVINWDQLGWYGETCETESPTLNRNQHNDGADSSSAQIWYVSNASTRSWPFPGVFKAKNLVFVLDRAAGFKPDLKKKRASWPLYERRVEALRKINLCFFWYNIYVL